MARVTSDDHLLELPDGRTIGYATWGDPEGTPVFIGHGTPGSRLDRYAGLDDPKWVRRRRVRCRCWDGRGGDTRRVGRGAR
jgi:hypothetical protein